MRFPLKYIQGMPWVNFKPYQYVMPAVNEKALPINQVSPPDISSVSLFLPGDYSENIAASWSEQDVLGGAAEGAATVGTELLQAASKGVGPKIAATISAATGQVSYPSDILIFDFVSPIELSFNFTMIPYNKAEGNEIINICKNFKKAVLPRLDASSDIAVLKFPAVWNITFNGIKGLGIEKDNEYSQMALINVSVDYGSSATSVLTFNDQNPVQIKLGLKFKATRKQRLYNV